MKRPAKKFALGTLAVSIIWILFEHLMGYNTTRYDIGEYTNNFPVIFYSIMLFATIYYTRRGHGNTLTFAEGFRAGVIMSVIFSLGFTIVIVLYHQFLNPDMLMYARTTFTQQFQDGKLTQSQLDEKMRSLEQMYGGSFMSYLELFIFMLLWGIGISVIASAILRKKPAGT